MQTAAESNRTAAPNDFTKQSPHHPQAIIFARKSPAIKRRFDPPRTDFPRLTRFLRLGAIAILQRGTGPRGHA
jgi:hypothetical protein